MVNTLKKIFVMIIIFVYFLICWPSIWLVSGYAEGKNIYKLDREQESTTILSADNWACDN